MIGRGYDGEDRDAGDGEAIRTNGKGIAASHDGFDYKVSDEM